MQVAVTGATGYIASRLIPRLREAGHGVIALSRDADRARRRDHLADEAVEIREVDLYDLESVRAGIEGAAAIVHLAGANIFERRWTKRFRQEIRDSRVLTTRVLVNAMGTDFPAPKVLLSGSAIGYYGPREPDDVCVEDEFDAKTFAPRDFLEHVCQEWEEAARRAQLLGTRVVRLRIGLVLDHDAEAYRQMAKPFRLYLGGPIGSGEQIVSWIHVHDAAEMMLWALESPRVQGPLNVVAPNPVSNRELAEAMGRALGKPSFLRTPRIALRIALGQVANVITTGQRVIPEVALDHGFSWRYPTIPEALADIVAAEEKAERAPAPKPAEAA